MLVDVEDLGSEVTGTWSFDSHGTMKHNPTQIRISPEKGITADGHDYVLSPNDIELNDGAVLGSGSCGVVRVGTHKPTGTNVAVKSVKMDEKERRAQLLHEIEGLIKVEGCPQLIQWYAGCISKATGIVHIVVELMDRGSLGELLSRLNGDCVPTQHVACIESQMIRGLRHLQARGIVHRDIKPENVLHNNDGHVKLTDFGISKNLASDDFTSTFKGTKYYMSPERCRGDSYSFTCDVWSAGVVAYELATGTFPFVRSTAFMELYHALCNQPEPRLDPSEHPHPMCDFVAKSLTRDQEIRLHAAQLAEHELFSDHGPEGRDKSPAFAEWLTTLPP